MLQYIEKRMKVDSGAIKRLARLARIRMPESKYEMYAKELSNIVDVIDKLQEVDTKGLEPLVSVSDHRTPLRADNVTDGNCDNKILSNAPKSKFGYFLVPKVVE